MIFPSLIIKIERWKFNKDYGVYVSTLGHIRDRHKRLLPIKINKDGYCAVRTERNFKMVHRLVMLTWRHIPDAESLTVDHLNHNKRDNSLQNLEWVSEEENLRRAMNDFIKPTYNKKTDEEKKEKDEKSESIIIYCVDDQQFKTVDDAIDYIENHLKPGLTYVNTDKIRTIFSRRKSNIGQICKYCGYVFKAEKQKIKESPVENTKALISKETTQSFIEKEEQKKEEIKNQLNKIQYTDEYSFKVNSKSFSNIEAAFDYATEICKKIFLTNLEKERVQEIYAKATIHLGQETSFCGIKFSASKKIERK